VVFGVPTAYFLTIVKASIKFSASETYLHPATGPTHLGSQNKYNFTLTKTRVRVRVLKLRLRNGTLTADPTGRPIMNRLEMFPFF
jgi:hypothetical protein